MIKMEIIAKIDLNTNTEIIILKFIYIIYVFYLWWLLLIKIINNNIIFIPILKVCSKK